MNSDSMKPRSFWLQQALEQETGCHYQPTLKGDRRADVAIIGGGYCGLWTAIELKMRDPSLSVVLLEKDYCGSGASGRNAGYALDLWPRFIAMSRLFGVEQALRIARASSDCLVDLEEFCTQKGIGQYRRNGWLWGATCEIQSSTWTPIIDALAAHGIQPFEELSGEQLSSNYGLEGHVGGVLAKNCGSVQPASLVRALMFTARDLGVEVYERTEMTELKTTAEPVVITPRARLRADRVVLALNAWGIRFPQIRRAIAVVAAEAAITQPIPDLLAKIGWTSGPAITDSRTTVTNYRATTDGRVEFGKAGNVLAFGSRMGRRINAPATRLPLIRNELAAAVPALAHVRPEYSWAGPIDRSFDGLPFFGRLDGNPRIHFGCGFSGNGVGPCLLGSRILASLTLGVEDEWSTLALVRIPRLNFPMEPFRAIGGRLVYRAVQRKDVAEHTGKTIGPITKWLASKVPTPLIPQRD